MPADDDFDLDEIDEADINYLSGILKNYIEETDSTLAKVLIKDTKLARFTKVMPREYKRVLLAQERAKKDGTDPMQAVMEVARG